MNAVDGFFGKLACRRSRRGVYESIEDLERSVRNFIELHNEKEAKPFKWTASPEPIKKSRSTLHSTYWPPATGRPNAPPYPTVCDSAVEAPDSGGRIVNRSSESLDFGSRGRSSRRRCSKTEP